MRRPLTAFAILAATAAATPPAAAAAAAQPAPDSPLEVVIEGKGYGHGVGLPQDGALAMGLAGASAGDILNHFYPGTAIGLRGGSVRVDLLDTPRASAVLNLSTGGVVEPASGGDQPGFPISVGPGGSVRVSFEGGRFHAVPLDGATASPIPTAEAARETAARAAAQAATTTTTVPSLLGIIPLQPAPTAPTSPTTAPPEPEPQPGPESVPEQPTAPVSNAPLLATPARGGTVGLSDLSRTYRGTITVTSGGGGLQLVNELDVEQYIRGMGEVIDPGWPQASLQVQAIIARTYALDAMSAGRALCSSQQCQVYLGSQAEYAAMNRAVADTTGQVVTFQGRLAEAVYSASAGGVTATPEEGFGMTGADYPYLKPVSYNTADPQAWEQRLGLDNLAVRVGYPGRATGAEVSRAGPSGRPLEVTITGDAGPQAIDARRFADTLDLRSNFFTIRVTGGAGATAAEAPTGAPRALRRPSLVLEAGPAAGAVPHGRAPWAAFAILLLAAWATAAHGTQDRRRTKAGDKAPAV